MARIIFLFAIAAGLAFLVQRYYLQSDPVEVPAPTPAPTPVATTPVPKKLPRLSELMISSYRDTLLQPSLERATNSANELEAVRQILVPIRDSQLGAIGTRLYTLMTRAAAEAKQAQQEIDRNNRQPEATSTIAGDVEKKKVFFNTASEQRWRQRIEPLRLSAQREWADLGAAERNGATIAYSPSMLEAVKTQKQFGSVTNAQTLIVMVNSQETEGALVFPYFKDGTTSSAATQDAKFENYNQLSTKAIYLDALFSVSDRSKLKVQAFRDGSYTSPTDKITYEKWVLVSILDRKSAE